MDDEEFSVRVDIHLRAMRGCSSQADAVKWMAEAYNLLEYAMNKAQRPKLFSIAGSFGEQIFTLIQPEKSIVLPPSGLRRAPPVWFEGQTVAYGDKFQNRAWTKKDTRKLELENARRAAQGISTKSTSGKQKSR